MHQSLWQLLLSSYESAGSVERLVLYLLCALSVLSWAIILMKFRLLKRARMANERFLNALDTAAHTGDVMSRKELARAPLFAALQAAVATRQCVCGTTAQPTARPDGHLHLQSAEKLGDRVLLGMQQAVQAELARINWGLDILASIGSSSPFVGLFGTVWGIMATFQVLGSAKSASLAVVAPGIATALIATAAGLVVAIPAVVAYNSIMARVEELQQQCQQGVVRIHLQLEAAGGLEG